MIPRSELARKSVHVGAGLLALLIPWLAWWQGVLICLAAFLMNWQVLPRVTHHFLEREEDRRRGYAPGILEYPLAVGALFLLFGSRMEVVAAAWAILAFGDGFATLAGRGLGGPKLPWNRGKTVSGFTAFVIAGGAAATLLALHVILAEGVDPFGSGPRTMFLTVATTCFAASLLAAFVESAETGIDDNLTVPLLAGAFLFALTYVRAALVEERSSLLLANLAVGAGLNLIIAVLALLARAVKPSGAVAGFAIGSAVYTFGGWRAFVILLLFFVLGTSATKVGYERKAAKRIAQEEGGRRSARHAIANCGVPAFLTFLSAATPHGDLFALAMVAALATAAFDTVSSEIGQVYGRHPFLITTFRRVPPGTDGAVSVEGTLAGLAAAAALAAAAWGLGMMGALGWTGAAAAVAGAFVGTTVESYLGAATLGSVGRAISRIDNEAMNFANTLVGGLAALALGALVIS